MFKHLNSLWMVFNNKRVKCLDLQTRKWKIQKNTLKTHETPGCIVTHDHKFLYIFSTTGSAERRIINDDYSPWEIVHTTIRFDCEIKFYPVPNKNNQFYLFGNTKTRKITIKDDRITQ